MPTLTNMETVVALDSLVKLSQLRLPVVGALRVRRLVRELTVHIKDVEGVRLSLLTEYSLKDEDGQAVVADGQYQFSDENKVTFEAAYKELMALTWEHDYVVRVADLGNGEIQPVILIGLGPLLEDAPE